MPSGRKASPATVSVNITGMSCSGLDVPTVSIPVFSSCSLQHEIQHLLADGLAELGELGLFAPKLEFRTHAVQHGLPFDPRGRLLAGGQEQPTCSVRLEMCGSTHELHLQGAMHRLYTRQCVHLVTYRLPFRQRKQP